MTPSRARSAGPGAPPGPPGPTHGRRSRAFRRAAIAVLGFAGVVVLVLAALRQPAVGTWLANAVLSRVTLLPRASARVAAVRGDWIGSLELHGLRVTRGDTLLAAVDTLGARYQLGSLLAGRLDVGEVALAGVRVTADARDTSRSPAKGPSLTLGQVLQGRFYTGLPLRIARLDLTRAEIGGHAAAPDTGFRLTRLALSARDLALGRGFGFRIDSLVGSLHPGGGRRDSASFALSLSLAAGRAELRRLRFRGDSSDVEGHGALTIGGRDTLQGADLTLHAQPLSFADLAGFVPGMPLAGTLYADVDLHGTRSDRLSGRASARIDRARVGAFACDAVALEATIAEGRAEAGARTRIEGATVTVSASGTPLAPEPSYAAELRADRLPARLPGLAWWEPLAARIGANLVLNVNGTGYTPATMDVTGRVGGDVGAISLDGHAVIGQALVWQARSLAFEHVDVARIAGLDERSALQGRITGNGSVDRDGRVRAEVQLAVGASLLGAMRIRSASASGRLEGTQLSGALHADSDAGEIDVGSFAMSTAVGGGSYLRDARFRDVDLARLLGSPALASRLSGSLSLDAHDLARMSAPPPPGRALPGPPPRVESRLELTPSTFRGQPIRSGEAHLTLAGRDARADIALETGAGTAHAIASAEPFAKPASARLEELRFDGVDLAAWTGLAALHSNLAGSASGAFRAGAGADLPARGSVALELRRSRLGGAALEAGELKAALSEDHVELEGSLRAAGNVLALHANATTHERRTEGSATCTLPLQLLADLAGRDSLRSRGSLLASTRFTADPSAPLHADGSLTGSGAVGRSRLDTLAATFRLERGLLRVDTLFARSNLATVRGGGRVVLDRASGRIGSDLALHLVANDVSPLKELLRADTVALASGELDLTLKGSESVRTVTLGGTLRSLAWNQFRLSGAELTSAGDLDRGGRPVKGSARVALRQLQGLPLPIRDASTEARLEGSRVEFVASAATDARTRAGVRGRADFDSLVTTVTLDSLAVDADTANWRLVRPSRLTLSPTRFRIDDLDVGSRGGRLTAHGGIDRRGTQDLDVVLHQVTLPGLALWVGRRDLTGVVDGRFAVRGAAAAASAEGEATLALATAGQPAGNVSLRGAWAERRARFGGAFSSPHADSLSWSADLPFAASLAEPEPGAAASTPAIKGPVHVRVRARRFPLASLAPFLDPLAVGTPSGTLDVDARLDGDERSLAGGGRLDVEAGVLPLPTLKVTYKDLAAHMEFQGDRLMIRELEATSGKGTLAASGEVRFASVSRVEPKVHVQARKFVFAGSPDLKATASCDVDVSGTLAAPVVKGSVNVVSSSFTFTQPDLEAASASEVRLSPADVRMMEETFGYVAPHAPALPLQLYDASDLELAIKMQRDNWVRQRVSPKLSVALTGDFRLRKQPHEEPELFGKIEPIPNRGYVQQFARSFDITGGQVLLNGKMKDHAVSIQAQFKPGSSVESSSSSTDVVVKLDVEGTPDRLRLTLSSEPPMSEAEIVNFIATGRSSVAPPTSSTGTSNSTLLRDIGLSQLSGPAETAAQEAVGLDVLEVRYDPLRGATLVAGRYVDPQLYVGFRSPLDYNQNTSTNSSNTTVNSTAFEVEYAISRWLVFNCQGETAKLRSFFRARYAY